MSDQVLICLLSVALAVQSIARAATVAELRKIRRIQEGEGEM